MDFTALDIAGAYRVFAAPVEDDRGHFLRHYHADSFRSHGLELTDAQISVSHNKRARTLRGIHYIPERIGEAKLVRCTAGRIFDVLVDFRPSSATYLQSFGMELSLESHSALYIPRGCGHGFITLEDDSDVTYQFSMPYRPGIEQGIRWDDPHLAVDWPVEPIHISDRDRALPALSELNWN